MTNKLLQSDEKDVWTGPVVKYQRLYESKFSLGLSHCGSFFYTCIIYALPIVLLVRFS